MTEPILQAAGHAIVAALTPEAEAILQDLKGFAQQELTVFGNKLPGLLASADQDVKDAIGALHGHIVSIIDRIEAHLAGRPVDPTPAPEAPTS